MSKASHPRDIYWENLAVTNDERKKRVIISFLIMFMTLIFSFGAILAIDVAKGKSTGTED